MDFELKSFEDKINDITEQFMSLLNSNNVDENSITTKLDSITNDGITGCDKTYPMTSTFDTSSNIGGISYRLDPNETRTNGIGGETIYNDSNIPAHAIRFDDPDELNKRLEELYNSKKFDTIDIPIEPKLTFADYGIGGFDSNIDAYSNNTNDKIYSANEKEGISMANYGYNVNEDNSIFSFATVPQERALAPQRSFSDVLFMDIPWDTKVDIWGGIKSFINAEVKFTF